MGKDPIIIIPIIPGFQMRKLRHRDIKVLAQIHPAQGGIQSQQPDSGAGSEFILLGTHACGCGDVCTPICFWSLFPKAKGVREVREVPSIAQLQSGPARLDPPDL